VNDIDLCSLDELVSGAARSFEVAGRHVCVVRFDDDVYAIGDRCSHADVALSDGDVLADSKEIECIKHGSAFSLQTGIPSCLPATQPVPVYHVTVSAGRVHLQLSGGAV
jgi:3-phenylpropionate/trans-cinnamate dioxygenase ferredoxin component